MHIFPARPLGTLVVLTLIAGLCAASLFLEDVGPGTWLSSSVQDNGQSARASMVPDRRLIGGAAAVPATFSLEAYFEDPEYSYRVEVGDMTGDGRDDLFVIQGEDYKPFYATLYAQTASGTLAAPVKYQLPDEDYILAGTAIGDLNEDGRDDLIITPAYSGGIHTLLSTPGGGFMWRTDRWINQRATAGSLVLDVDRDGHLDVLTHVALLYQGFSRPVTGQFITYFGDGTGHFPRHAAKSTNENAMVSMAIGDMDADGHSDLVVVSRNYLDRYDSSLSLMRHDGIAGFLPPSRIYLNLAEIYDSVATADLDADGRTDFVTHNDLRVIDKLLVFRQTPSGLLPGNPSRMVAGNPTLGSARQLLTVDLDGDGRKDILHGIDSWPFLMYRLQRAGGFAETVRMQMPWYGSYGFTEDGLASGDFNGDGVTDIAQAGGYYGLTLLRGRMTPYTGTASLPGAPTMISAALDPQNDPQLLEYAEVLVSFSPPASTGGAEITGYTVHSTSGDGVDGDAGSTELVHRFRFLEPGKSYAFNVTAKNAAGEGAASTTSNSIAFGSAAVPHLQVFELRVMEGDSGTAQAAFVISLSEPVAVDVTFNVDTVSGYAQEGSDFAPLHLVGVKIPAGSTSATINVAIHGDDVVENEETFNISLSNIAGIHPGSVSASVSIVNDDWSNQLKVSNAVVSEGHNGLQRVEFTASVSTAQHDGVSFSAVPVDGSARAGMDYISSYLAGIIIPRNEQTVTFAFDIVGDSMLEPDETFSLKIENTWSAEFVGANPVATIVNDDVGNGISVHDVTVEEGDDGQVAADFRVELSEPLTVPVAFDITTEQGSSTAGVDFEGKTASGMVIPAGQTSGVFRVMVNSDTVAERHETFAVELRKVVGAKVVDGRAIGLIRNDDFVDLKIEDVQVVEGNEGFTTAYFTIRLSAPSTYRVIFDIASDMRGPTYDTDYLASYRDMSIDAGRTTVQYKVQVRGDTLAEDTEQFNIIVQNVRYANAVDTVGVGTIIDDDLAAVRDGSRTRRARLPVPAQNAKSSTAD